jgi:hypothetical protein
LKILISIAFLLFVQEFALANAAHVEGMEVNCDINASVVKKAKDEKASAASVDLRIVTMPLLKLSGKSVVLKPGMQPLGCRHHYEGLLDENTGISACSNHEDGEPLKIEKVGIVLIDPPPGMPRHYFCIPKSSSKKEAPEKKTKSDGALS